MKSSTRHSFESDTRRFGVICDDSEKGLRDLPDGSFNVVVTSPPITGRVITALTVRLGTRTQLMSMSQVCAMSLMKSSESSTQTGSFSST